MAVLRAAGHVAGTGRPSNVSSWQVGAPILHARRKI